MGKIAIICFGICLMLLSGYGVSNNLQDKERLASRGDQETDGKVLYVTESQAKDGTTRYGLRYSFRTPDGKAYAGGYRGTEPELKFMKNGDVVTVRYASGDPRQSTAFAAFNPKTVKGDPAQKAQICFGVGAFGLLVTVLGFFCKSEVKHTSEPLVPRKFSDDPAAALQLWRREWELAPKAFS